MDFYVQLGTRDSELCSNAFTSPTLTGGRLAFQKSLMEGQGGRQPGHACPGACSAAGGRNRYPPRTKCALCCYLANGETRPRELKGRKSKGRRGMRDGV